MPHPVRNLLAEPAYRRVLGGSVLFAAASWLEQLAVGWYVFDTTGSVFLTALAWSARSAPNLFFGPISGALADRYPRQKVLAVNALVRSVVVGAMAGVMAFGEAGLATTVTLLFLVALGGMSNTANLASANTLAADVAPANHLGVAVSLLSFAQRAALAVSVLLGGIVLARLGPVVVFAAVAISLVLAAVTFHGVRSPPRQASREALFASALDGFKRLARLPAVLGLLILMAVAEIFGFSYSAFLPSIASDTLATDASGLGVLMSAAALGAMAGVGVLALTAPERHRGRMLIGVIAAFGMLVVALPLSSSLPVSFCIVAAIGACAASVDALQWIMLQAEVDESMRGRVLGAWNVAIGFGWLGPMLLGLLAERSSVVVALGCAGVVLAAGAALAVRTSVWRL